MKEGKQQNEEEEVENKARLGKYRNHIMKDTQKPAGERQSWRGNKREGRRIQKQAGMKEKLCRGENVQSGSDVWSLAESRTSDQVRT